MTGELLELIRKKPCDTDAILSAVELMDLKKIHILVTFQNDPNDPNWFEWTTAPRSSDQKTLLHLVWERVAAGYPVSPEQHLGIGAISAVAITEKIYDNAPLTMLAQDNQGDSPYDYIQWIISHDLHPFKIQQDDALWDRIVADVEHAQLDNATPHSIGQRRKTRL